MDSLCESDFWNWNSTWYTDSPNFTSCFKATVLIWIPCAFLWIFLPLQIYNLKKSEFRDIPWNCLNSIKLILILITAILAISDLLHRILVSDFEPKVYIFSTVIDLITSILFLILTNNCRKMGIRSSGILLLYSFLRVICGLPNLATSINNWNWFWIMNDVASAKKVSCILSYLCNILIFVLNCFADERPRHTLYSTGENMNQMTNTSVLSDVFLTWMDSYFWKNYKKPTNKILWYYYWRDDGSENLLDKKKGDMETISILKLLNNEFGPIFWFSTFLCIVLETTGFIVFVVAHRFSIELENNEQMWKCYMYLVWLIGIPVAQIFINSYYWNWCYKLEIKVKNAVLITLYQKALKISGHARTEYTTSDIVKMMSVDVNLLQSLSRNIHSSLSVLIFSALAFIYLGIVLGPSIWFAVIVSVISLVISYYGSLHLKSLQKEDANYKGIRNRFMQEIFSGIKVLKMYAWENSFKNSANKLRKKEEENLKRIQFVYSSLQLFLTLTPFLLYAGTYLFLFLTNPYQSTDDIVPILSMMLFYVIRNFFTILPANYIAILQGIIAIKRIDRFLSAEELNTTQISHDLNVRHALVMKNATFSWQSNKGPAMLTNLNIQIEKGELIAVIGSVGTGKSSFINACLGEMYKMSGYTNTKGTVAYVPQQAWILNTSLKNNVILNDNVDDDLYEKALEVCALKQDIETFPGGDSTEIGEKGINLSGGQKQRVSLARAVYRNADVYYFDDPLSALDSEVANHVFHKAIGSESILKEKTRILVTHSAKFFPLVDKIIVLKNGQIVEIGTYEELLSSNVEFVELMRANSQEEMNNEETSKCELLFDKGYACTNTVRPESYNKKIQNIFRKSVRKDRSSTTKVQDSSSSKLIDDEIIKTEKVHKRLFYAYISTSGACLTINTIIFLALAQTVSVIGYGYISVWMAEDNPWDKKYVFLAIYSGLGIIQGICFQIGNICLFKGTLKTSNNLYNKLLDGVLHWPMYLFDTIPVGRIIGRFSDDVHVLDNVIGYIIGQALISIYRTFTTYLYYLYMVPETIVIMVPTCLLYYGVQVLYNPTFHQMKRVEAVHRSPLYSHLVESVTGIQSIRAYNLDSKFIALTKQKNKLCSQAYYSSTKCTTWLFNRCEIIGVISYLCVLLISIYVKNYTHISYVVTIAIGGVTIIKLNIIMLTQQSILGESILSMERIQQYIKQPQEASWNRSFVTVDENWPQKGEIVFKDYKSRYRTGLEYVLKGINFKMNSGEKVGIIGRTGAGKTSLFLALFRIVEPSYGTIFIDGVDITKLGLHVLRSKLTIIPQDPVLFSGTLRFNIDPFELYSDEKLWNVLEKSHLKQYIQNLPGGLNYIIEEGGNNLSYGQRQLICLTRALLRKTKILVLDEATASVDVKTDELIQKTIRDEFSDCTVVTIAHRLNTLQNYDKILILDDGKIVKYDTVENVMKLHNLNSSHLK